MKDLAQKLACYRKCPGYVIFMSISTGLIRVTNVTVLHCLRGHAFVSSSDVN